MNYTTIISYDEIALKSWNIRKRLVIRLATNIKVALKSWNLSNFKVRNEWDKLFIDSNSYNEATNVALITSKVFGVENVSPASWVKFNTLKDIIKTATEFARGYIFPKDSFLLNVKIKGSINFSKQDLTASLREKLEKEIPGSKGNFHRYIRELYVEIRENMALFYGYKLRGPGGFPLGTNGKIVCLVSGGIDSPVASWLMMKRGMHPVFVHFDTTLREDEKNIKITREKIHTLIKDWGYSKTPFKFYIVPYGQVLSAFQQSRIAEDYICIFCKRYMLRIAEQIATKENAHALMTGDSLAQVASQTAWNLVYLDQTVNLPIYRPLIAFNKQETVALARKIGTFTESIQLASCCEAVPASPILRSDKKTEEEGENQIYTENLVKTAIEKSKLIEITST